MNKQNKKEEYKNILLKKVDGWLKEGFTPEQAIEKLTVNQYDFLIDNGIDFDKLLLSPQQVKNIAEIKRAKRGLSPQGYNKKYPEEKKQLYNGICKYLISQGAEIVPPQKPNYRDLDFSIDGKKYRIVLSNPRS